ncbi:GGDEF domain-containing protein [Rhizobium sp. PAMB 3182]
MQYRSASVMGSRMVPVIYLACAVIAGVFAAAGFMVLDYSVKQAEVFAIASERKLVQQEFQHQIDQVAKLQAELSYSDRTVDYLRAPNSADLLAADPTVRSIWSDLGFAWVVFTSAGNTPLLAIKEGKRVEDSSAGDLMFWIDDLIFEAKQKFRAALKDDGGRLSITRSAPNPDSLELPMPDIYASDMRMLFGEMSIVVVQGVVPRSPDGVLPFNGPRLLITVKPISKAMLAGMDTRLHIRNLHVVSEAGKDPADASTPVGNGFTDGPYLVAWTPNTPDTYIWSKAGPKVVVAVLIALLVLGYIAVRFGSVVHALQRSEARNSFLANHDALTGLANRAGFDAVLGKAADERRPFSLIAMDLDLFKAVNDRYGHTAGDAVLKDIANRLRDRIGKQGLVGRLGGDEFMAFLDGVIDRDEVMAIATGLVRDAQVPVLHDGVILQVGGSAGAAIFPKQAQSVRELVLLADEALYAAKDAGRNCAVMSGEHPVAGIVKQFA